MELSIGTLDRKIWSKDLILEALYKCFKNNDTLLIDFSPEGSCARSLGLYELLDKFCLVTGYAKNNITIKTANMVESHPGYNIKRDPKCWYEIGMIQEWLGDKNIISGHEPSKHFANFSSRTNWSRLWIATILDTYYSGKTLQTYHYDVTRENYNPNRYTGLDDVIRQGCDLYVEAAKFIKTCPRTLDIGYLKNLENTKGSVFQHENSYYPIQHPSNLNLLQYYRDIFVDIVVEPNVSGRCFLVTEKLWRPILAKRPFIVMSNANYLDNLRRLGFKTFNNFWSEEYDLHSEANRIHNIEQLLVQISAWTSDELSNKLLDMDAILTHNFNTFSNLNYKKLIEVFG
jgi:hypothetical protein